MPVSKKLLNASLDLLLSEVDSDEAIQKVLSAKVQRPALPEIDYLERLKVAIDIEVLERKDAANSDAYQKAYLKKTIKVVS